MTHLGTKTLETDRLILRRFTIGDADAMFANWANDPDVTKFLMWQPHGNTDVTKAILGEWVSRYGEDDFYNWAITLKSNGGEPIGSIAVVDKHDHIEMVHIGYCLGKNWWRRGIMSEALGALVKFFFEEVRVNRIESRHDTRNPNSGKVMLKCGLLYEGTHRDGDHSNQGIGDSAMYAILAADYREMIK